MSSDKSTRTPAKRRQSTFVAALTIVAVVGIAGCQSLASSPGPSLPSTSSSSSSSSMAAVPAAPPRISAGELGDDSERRSVISTADGKLPGGVTVLDNRYPGVTKLDPSLRAALRRAATDAAASKITFVVDSGWRSTAYQQQLLNEAITKYGSKKEAARWVATPETSAHVTGDAVDIGPSNAATWLSKHGAKYGLCQIYKNEAWHFELRSQAVNGGCPAMYADPTHDPRMQ